MLGKRPDRLGSGWDMLDPICSICFPCYRTIKDRSNKQIHMFPCSHNFCLYVTTFRGVGRVSVSRPSFVGKCVCVCVCVHKTTHKQHKTAQKYTHTHTQTQLVTICNYSWQSRAPASGSRCLLAAQGVQEQRESLLPPFVNTARQPASN